MRKIFLFLLAASVITSCDNLKKKDAKTDDDEEVTPKKKKKVIEDDEITDDQATKKKKVTDDDTPVKRDQDNTDDDYTNKKTTNYNSGWATSDESDFMKECTRTATPKVGEERAQTYCSCMMGKMEKQFSSLKDANRMSETQLNNWATECNQQ